MQCVKKIKYKAIKGAVQIYFSYPMESDFQIGCRNNIFEEKWRKKPPRRAPSAFRTPSCTLV